MLFVKVGLEQERLEVRQSRGGRQRCGDG